MIEKHNGDVPDDMKCLLELKGVGPKIATLVIAACFGRQEGIVVDVHVHKIANRIGWVKTKTPEETKKALESFVPFDLWKDVNLILVGVGQQVCTSPVPRCGICTNRNLCPVGKSRMKNWMDDETRGSARSVGASTALKDLSITSAVTCEIEDLGNASNIIIKEENVIKEEINLDEYAAPILKKRKY